MILIKNKLILLGFISAFLFFLTLLVGFIYGVRPIEGAERFSDGRFSENVLELKPNILYKFVCDFEPNKASFGGRLLNIDDKRFSIISNRSTFFKFMHLDKRGLFDMFWSRDYEVYYNRQSSTIYYLQNSNQVYKLNMGQFDEVVKDGRIKVEMMGVNNDGAAAATSKME